METRSAEVLSLAVMATLLPQALLGPLAGVYVDRWKRKRTLIAADMFVAFCSLILGLLFSDRQNWGIFIYYWRCGV